MSQRTTNALSITVNGDSQPYQPQTIRELLMARGLDPDKQGIAVAVDARVVHRADWNATHIQPGSRVDIVRATAGG